MPTINKRFLFKLLLVLFASLGVLFAAHAVQSRRIPAALKAQAERAADSGKTDIAIHYLRQYLEFHPDDLDALDRLAGLISKRAVTHRGLTELLFLYDRILRIDPDRHDTRRAALAVAIRIGRNPDAVSHAEALLRTFPKDAALWHDLGVAQTGLNEIGRARESFEKCISCDPGAMIGYQRLAQMLWKNANDTAGARAVLDRMQKAIPLEPETHLIRARFEAHTADEPGMQAAGGGDLARARTDLLRVLELDPENAEATLLLAEVMQRQRNIPAAHALLRDAASTYPRNIRIVRALSWLELIRGNAASAITVLEDGLKAIPDGFDLMVPLADLLVQQGDTQRTAEILQRLQQRRAPATQVKYLKARVAMREQQWAGAVGMLEALRAEVTNLPGLELQLNLLLAQCFQKLADPAAEEKAYQRVTNADPRNVLARVGLANLYMNLGRFEEAARELDFAVQSPYATGVVVTQWLKLKARVLAQANAPGEWLKLEAATDTYAGRFGRGSAEPRILRAELMAAQGRLGEAVGLLRQEAARRSVDAHLWATLALMTADLSGAAAGLVVVDEAQAFAGDCVDVRLARATLYAREPGRIRPIDPIAERADNWPESEQLRLFAGLVEVYDRLGDKAGVVRLLRRIVARQPANAAMWLKLHERSEPADESARAARGALAKLEGDGGPSVLLCDARAATAADAPALAARMTAAFGATPSRADACLALASLKRMGGDDAAAAALTERAFVLEPTKYEAAEALLAQLARSDAAPRLNALLARLALDPRWAGEPFRRVVGHVLSVLAPQQAVGVFNACRALVEREPGGPGWLADTAVSLRLPDAPALLDAACGPRGTADDYLRKALVVSKDDAKAGPAVLAAAKPKLRPEAHAALVAVYADTAAGSTFVPEAATPAEKRLLAQARLSVKLSRAQTADAGQLLNAFLADKDTQPADADWARRNMAMLYAVGGAPEDRVRAMQLLKSITTDTTATPTELRSTVGVLLSLSRYLEGPDRRAVIGKAVVALEAVYKSSNAPGDLFAISQLLRAANDRPGSRKALQQLLSRDAVELGRDPSYTTYLTAALDELVEDNNFEGAEAFANKLLELRVGDFKSLASIARLEARAGRPERGLAVAEDYARLAEAGGDYLVRSARVAELLDELSRLPNVRGTPAGRKITDAAAERFCAIVPTRPEAIVGAAGALSADGRAAAAFEQIEKLGRYIPARLRASAGLAIARGGPLTDRQAQTVQKWIDDCLADEPDSVSLLLSKGEFFATRHDTAKAAAAFEKVLAKEPRNVVALNNLAWLLAADAQQAERALELVTRATREGGLTGDLLDTRARVRITLKQFAEAERDLAEAIAHEPTALRWFHVALLRTLQTPPNPAQAKGAFAEAVKRGLDERSVHPADAATFRALAAAK
jgi:tetratricopeptide (TPR) repeat protein